MSNAENDHRVTEDCKLDEDIGEQKDFLWYYTSTKAERMTPLYTALV